MKIPYNILKDQHKHFSFIDVSLLHNGHRVSGHLQGGENKNKSIITIHSLTNSAVNLTKSFKIFKLWSDLGTFSLYLHPSRSHHPDGGHKWLQHDADHYTIKLHP
jgi:hypothetical protein